MSDCLLMLEYREMISALIDERSMSFSLAIDLSVASGVELGLMHARFTVKLCLTRLRFCEVYEFSVGLKAYDRKAYNSAR